MYKKILNSKNKFLLIIGMMILSQSIIQAATPATWIWYPGDYEIWLGNKKTAMYSVIAVSQWQSLGYIVMLFIVAIQKIPEDLYEAATVDGAGKLKRFFYITVPQVRSMFFVTMILTVVGAFTVFNEPYILTSGGPGTATMVLSLHMYQTGFVKNNMGYASAIAMLIFVITAVLSSVQFFSFGSDEEG